MGSLLQCLFCLCCDKDDEGEQQPQHDDVRAEPLRVVRMTRGARIAHYDSAGIYQVAPQGPGDEGEEETVENCCQPGSGAEDNEHSAGIREFFRKLRAQWRMHDSIEVIHESPQGEASSWFTKTPANKIISSPLRTASSFDSSRAVPTICAEEVVIPGSHLQKEMARAMSQNLESQDDECVICMERFDDSNPRMPTLCGCGENKTYFHLPCLYQWVEQCQDCPSCRQKLRWEEF